MATLRMTAKDAQAAGKTRTRRAPRVDREGMEQKALIRWLYGEKMRGGTTADAYDHTYHVPNGGQRSKATAAALKGQGVKAGVSDLVVALARGGYHGLYLEFKATPPDHAALADSQREWLGKVEQQGYCAVLARGLDEAKAVIREYMGLSPTVVTVAPQRVASGTEWRKPHG